MNAYEYGVKLAAPWSPLRAGLQHGAAAAVPGALVGGLVGAAKGVTRPDGTKDRMGGALRGAAIGGAATGLLGGATSARMQHGMNEVLANPALVTQRMAAKNLPPSAATAMQQHLNNYTEGSWVKPFTNMITGAVAGAPT